MELFDKIDQYYKIAQNTLAPHQMLVDAIHKVMDQISQHPKMTAEEKEAMKRELQKPFNGEHPASHLDAMWYNHLANAMDVIIGAYDSAQDPEMKSFHYKMCEVLGAVWDQIVGLGHKAHVDKPILC